MSVRYYLSGKLKMRGLPDYGDELFAAVEAALEDHLVHTSYSVIASDPGMAPVAVDWEGWEIVSPARNSGDHSLPRERYMREDIAAVLRADVLVALPNWADSPGARLEAEVAYQTGKRLMVAYESPLIEGEWRFADVGYGELLATPGRPETSPRADLLREAETLITGDRNSQYGPPLIDFARTAGIITALGYQRAGGAEIKPHDVAIIMIALKLSRLMWTEVKRDTWVDVAGYAACGYEVAAAASDEARDAAT